jgi:2-polyprenyl-3-methyl-5-hydroxy-6-metoxy-1,4-benzoquinol methylase
MARHCEVQMPEDWNDHASWNQYYEAQIVRTKRNRWDYSIGSIPIDQLPSLARDLKSRGERSVWVPGCGLSPLAYLLAHLGLEVVATDVSSSAVQFQRERGDAFRNLTRTLGLADPAGSLVVELHDFRSEFCRGAFDLIINVKAIQAFPLTDMGRIAKNHAMALRKGRFAYFDTMNVQGERRDQLEKALEDGGFIVPLTKLNRWYREELQRTGIPYAFLLGQPMIPRTGEYANGGPKWDQDMARLREISADYRARLETEQESERLRIGSDAKVAHVIYSTG